MRTVVVALLGGVLTAALVLSARRHQITDRFPPRSASRARMLPRWPRGHIARALDDAAIAHTPEQAVQAWLFAAGIAAVVGFGLSPAVGGLAGAGVLAAGPVMLALAGSRRGRLISAAVPATLEQVGAELRVGGTVATALAAIAAGDGPLAPDITRVESRVRLGASLPDALESWARERPAAGIEATAGALALSATVGGRASDALDALASSLRDRLSVAAEARALSAQARYSAWVIGVAPVGYIVGSAAIDPRSLHALIGTGAGRACALAGAALEVIGALWMRAIVRGGEAA